jgi:YNFM family putative membrane transporter
MLLTPWDSANRANPTNILEYVNKSDEILGFRHLIWALTFVSFMVSATTRMLETLLPPIAEGLGASLIDMGMVIGAFSVGYGIVQPLTALFAERLGKLKLISTLMVAGGIFTYACSGSNTISELTIFRFFSGLSLGACIALSLAYIGEFVAFEERQSIITRFLTGILLGQIFGACAAGLLSEAMSWRQVFDSFGALTAFSGLLLASLIFRRRVSDSKTNGTVNPLVYWNVLTSQSARPTLLIAFLEGTFFFSSFAFVASFLRDIHQWDYLKIGLIMTGYGFGGAGYAFLSASINAKITTSKRIFFAGLTVAFAYGLFPWLTNGLSFFICFMAIGFGFYMLHVILQTNATEMYPQARGASMCMFALLIFTGQSLGAPAFAQLIILLDYKASYALSAIACLGLALLFRKYQHAPK